MKYICSLLTVSDLQKSRKFYEEVLGQKVKVDHGENVTYHGDFAIHMKSHFETLIDNKKVNPGKNNIELYFEHDNVDEMVQLLKKHQVTFVHECREQPWRQKVVRFYDPDHYIIEVGESMEFLARRLANEGMDLTDIAKTINLPQDFVKKAIQEFC